MKAVTIFLFILHGLCTAAQPPFTLVDSRAVGSNSITLRCRRSSDDTFDREALYFLNGTRVDSIDGFVDTSQDPESVVFAISRRLEGEYSCGTENQKSDSLSFIAFPDSTLIPPSPPVYTLVGKTARLQCGIQPGALLGQYFARWFNGTTGRTLYNYPTPSQRLVNPSLETRESPRYTIDPSDLSLMIGNVQLNDSLGSYHCELGVVDPRSPGRMTYIYAQTTGHNIGLEVVAPPRIVNEFIPNTVIAEGQNVNLKCVAQGFPAPTISWQHAGRGVVTASNPRFMVNSTVTERSDGFISTVTSYFKIDSADDLMNGEVVCTANPPPPERIGGKALDRVQASTRLTVLGYFNDLEIEITTKSDVIIIVNLPRALPVLVNLVILYRDVENPSAQPDKKITEAAYLNTAMITHIDFSSKVPFEHFTAEVGLSSQGVRGPLMRAQGEFAKDQPTLFEKISTNKIIIIGSVPGTIILVITIVIGLVCCIWHKQTLNHRFKCFMFKNTSEVLDTLQEHLEKKQHIELSIKKKLIALVRAGIPLLDPEKNKSVSKIDGTQISQLSNQVSHRDGDSTGYNNDHPDCPDHEFKCTAELQNQNVMRNNINHMLQAPPSYEAAISQTEISMEPELVDLLAGFVCDSVRATMHQDHNPELANHVEREVTGHVYQRQKSVVEQEESRIKQLQSLQPGTAI